VIRLACTTIGALLLLVACQQPSGQVVATPAPTTAAPPAAASPTVGPVASPAAVTASPAVSPVAKPAGVPSPSPAASPSPVACQFQAGFKELRDLVGAATVGECLEPERPIPGNGNVEQRTTNGLLVYRAIDGRVLFIGANQTSINRDGTVVTRANDERLEWEGDRQLVETLRRGGQIVYFRHGPTDPSQSDTDPKNLANCATQRNLTDAGRAQARAIGEAIRALNIPVGPVLSSEYCRALEYSRLMFDRAEPEPSLVLPDPLTEPEKAQNTEALKRLLMTPPTAGTNTVLVSHSPNIRLAAEVDLPVEGSAAVFRVQAQGAPTLVARVLPDEWPALARALRPR
jgi:phosphohistidine phosphatase SixA